MYQTVGRVVRAPACQREGHQTGDGLHSVHGVLAGPQCGRAGPYPGDNPRPWQAHGFVLSEVPDDMSQSDW